jgi:acetate kinase
VEEETVPVPLPEPRYPGEDPPLVLALDVGASSLEAVVRDPDLRMHVDLSGLDRDVGRLVVSGTGSFVEHSLVHDGWDSALSAVAEAAGRRGLHPAVVVHRLAHGGEALVGPRVADDELLRRMRDAAAPDPLLLPRQLDVVDASRAFWPGAVQVLCPDTLFHRGLPDEAVTLPLPAEERATGLRRSGASGLALASVVRQLPDLGAAVVVHLGSGWDVTAVDRGRPCSTTAAVGSAGGLPSPTGSGDLDPEVVLRMVGEHGGSVDEVRRILHQRAGAAGLSGGENDVARLLDATDPAADLAVRVLVRQVAMAVAGAVTTLDRWDALVFTGRTAVACEELRERVCARLLPLRPGAAASAGRYGERLGAAGLRVVVVTADVGAELDRVARAVVGAGRAPTGEHRSAPLAGRP